MSIYLVRHTSVAVAEGLCYGITEVPLENSFNSEVAVLLRRLPIPPSHVLSSPAVRCQKLAAAFDVSVTIDARLRELNFGDWENRLWEDIPKVEIDSWSKDFVNRAPPGGESFQSLANRAVACLEEATRDLNSANIVCVTHAGVIRALIATSRGMPLAEAFSLPVAFGSIHLLQEANRTLTIK